MTDQDIKRIEEAALNYTLNHEPTTTAIESVQQNSFQDGAKYEHSIAYEQGFQDGFKKQDNEMYNKAIDDVLLRLAYLGVFQDKSHPRYIEIQKLKK